MEREGVLRVGKGLVDAFILRVRKGNPLRLHELVLYMEAPSSHTKNVCRSNWGNIWYINRMSMEGIP